MSHAHVIVSFDYICTDCDKYVRGLAGPLRRSAHWTPPLVCNMFGEEI